MLYDSSSNLGEELFLKAMRKISEYASGFDEFSLTERMVYYMNGRNGTDFDWTANGHTSHFFLFYDEKKTGSNYGFLNAIVRKDGVLEIFVYTGLGKIQSGHVSFPLFTESQALYLLHHLLNRFDYSGFSDEPCFSIDGDCSVDPVRPQMFVSKDSIPPAFR